MKLDEIISISGKNGLYKVVGKTTGKGLIVESLENKKRLPVFASHQVSKLTDISVYTASGNSVPLSDVFKKIFEKENGGTTIDHKSDAEKIMSYFAEVLPEYDKEKVHYSDVKKLFQWYNNLQPMGLLKPEEKEENNQEQNPKSQEEPSPKQQ